jgi:hypothetical protein
LLIALGFLSLVACHSSAASLSDYDCSARLESDQACVASAHERVEADIDAVTVPLDEKCHRVSLRLI